jgi:hypothetical protein
MSFPRYPTYKPSGVEWLGEVPEHWVLNKICAISSLKGRLGWQGLKADEYREQGPYVGLAELPRSIAQQLIPGAVSR